MNPKKTALVTILLQVFFSFLLQQGVYAGNTPPFTTLTKTPSTPNGKDDWYLTPVNILLTATDLESGVASINYKIDSGNWVTVTQSDTLNLAPNPSFETTHAGSSINTLSWEAGLQDGQAVYSRNTLNYVFGTTSIKINSTGAAWHSINHSVNYAVANPLSNMSAEVWLKTESAGGSAYFKIFAVSKDINDNFVYTEVAQSNSINGTTTWTKISENFVVSVSDAIGVYMEVGLLGTGILYVDGVSINNSAKSADTSFTVSSDGNHTVSYYSTDRSGNIETTKSTTFKIDQTPPTNWRNSNAYRGVTGPSDHHLYVTTVVDDTTSGISTLTDKFQYHTDRNPGFGSFSDLMQCSSTWQPDTWAPLISPPFSPGATTVTLLTPKTDFCDSVWKICKTVRFYAEDMAGNSSTKDLCINGPWIKIRGGGLAGSRLGINMLSESSDKNTDSVIEAGNTEVNFFTSTKSWVVKNNIGAKDYSYTELLDAVKTSPTEIFGTLPTTDGVYIKNGNFTITATSVPNNYDTSTFKQIVFINGNLRFDKEIVLASTSAVLFVVSGNVEIKKTVSEVTSAIHSDGTFYTAYDTNEGDQTGTLRLKGVFVADKFIFQRTLQGTDNVEDPSEDFTYEPRFGNLLREYIGINAVRWLKSE